MCPGTRYAPERLKFLLDPRDLIGQIPQDCLAGGGGALAGCQVLGAGHRRTQEAGCFGYTVPICQSYRRILLSKPRGLVF